MKSKKENILEEFTLFLGESCVIEKKIMSSYHKAMKYSKCVRFIRGKITSKGEIEYLFIGQYCDAIHLIECFKDKKRFHKKVYFTVIDQHHTKEVIVEFEGTFLDALQYISANAKKYVGRSDSVHFNELRVEVI